MTPETPPRVVLLVILAAVGVCMMAASTMLTSMLGSLGGWPVLAAGTVVLVASLAALWLIERKRDRSLG